MQQIVPPIALAQKILGQQKTDSKTPYRLTVHSILLEQPEGVLLQHTLTGELLLLSHEEARQLAGLPGPIPPALGELIPRWFLRPEGADDMALADRVRQIAGHFEKKDGFLTEYLIFLTTVCNARCFYCFEAGIRKAVMSEDTARAAGAYIAEHRGGKPVSLVWFGGEPLTNVRAIDAISTVLRQRDVPFHSRMDSNGYLFDEALAARAKSDWGLDEIQITVDGTEEVYNRRKAFPHPSGSPFQRVLRNIGLLLDSGVRVGIRLNMDGDNEKDLYTLVDSLSERFAGASGFSIGPRVIVENKGTLPRVYTEEERCALGEKARALWAYLDEKGVAPKRPLKRGLLFYACWSDKANAATITPEGRLGRCESHIDRGLWGSVFSEDRDERVLRQWRKHRAPMEICRACALYPRCIRLKSCVLHTERCSPIERAEMQISFVRAILKTYEDWKADHLLRTDAV